MFKESFEREKAQKKSQMMLKKFKSAVGSNDASKINRLVVKRFGENSRHNGKFTELAIRL